MQMSATYQVADSWSNAVSTKAHPNGFSLVRFFETGMRSKILSAFYISINKNLNEQK